MFLLGIEIYILPLNDYSTINIITSSQSETIPSPHFQTPPLFVERERERERTVEEEEESSCPCVECEVPRELLLHRSELIPPPVLGYE